MRLFLSILTAFVLIASSTNAQKKGAIILHSPLVDIEYQISSLSPNGKWACGNINDGYNHSFVWNLTTNELRELAPMGLECFALGVSNDGVVVGNFTDATTSVEKMGYWKDGRWNELPTTVKDAGTITTGMVNCISADGQYMAGLCCTTTTGSVYWPIVWHNGEAQLLKLPEVKSKAGSVYGISCDGKFCGWVNDNVKSNRTPALWTSLDAEPIMLNPNDLGPFATANSFSPNGNFVAAFFSIYDANTGSHIRTFDGTNVRSMNIYGVTNDGEAYGSVSMDDLSTGGSGKAYIWDTEGNIIDVQDMLADMGVNLAAYNVFQCTGISEDKNTYALYAYDERQIPRALIVKLNENIETREPVAVQAKAFEGTSSCKVTWQQPLANAENVSAYNVMRDGEKVGSVDGSTLFFIDKAVAEGTHSYTVTASYGDAESQPSLPAEATIGSQPIASPQNLLALQSSFNNVRLLWDAPKSNLPAICYTSDSDEVVAMGGGTIDFESAIRIDAADLAVYGSTSHKIGAVSFIPYSEQKSWTINIYDATDDTTPLYSEVIDATNFVMGQRNTATLSQPFDIPAGKDLLVAVSVEIVSGGSYSVMGLVPNVSVHGYSDLIRQKVTDPHFYSLYDRAQQSENGSYEYNASWPIAVHFVSDENSAASRLVDYQISHDALESVATTTETKHMVENLSDGTHTFAVSAHYADGSISEPATAEIKVRNNTNVYKAIDAVSISVSDQEMTATWQEPSDNDQAIVTFASDECSGGVRGNEANQYSYMAATEYDINQLRPYEDFSIIGFRFFPLADAEFTFYLRNQNKETLAELPIERVNGYTLNKWNTVMLDEPVKLNRNDSYTLMLDCFDVTAGEAPLGFDNQTAIARQTDLYSTNGGETLSSLISDGVSAHNWMMGLVVGASEPRQLPVEGYNIYIDGNSKTNTEVLTEPRYAATLGGGSHHLRVGVIYGDNIGEKKSERFYFTIDGSNSISAVQTSPNAPTIYYDLQGRRVTSPTSGGLYISNKGRKSIIK